MVDPPLPGHDLLTAGLADLRRGRETEAALLVALAAPRLRALGIDVPDGVCEPAHRLYEMLEARYGAGAHSRYNALIGRMASYVRAAEHARTR